MNKLDLDYQRLLQDILDNGTQKMDRTGTGTISVFGRQIRHKMSDGFPLLTTKKMYFKGIVTELLWFLRGDTNIKYLVENNCHIWDGDAYKSYEKQTKKYTGCCPECGEGYENEEEWEDEDKCICGSHKTPTRLSKEEFIEKIKTDNEFAKKWGDLGPIYGKQWRKWQKWIDMPSAGPHAKGSIWVDQIGMLINDLKTNPDSRRLMVTAWNPAEIDQMVLPPCHYGFQCYTRELSTKERWEWYGKNGDSEGQIKLVAMIVNENEEDNSHIKSWLEQWAPTVPKRAISLMWNQRSVDTFLGLPFNIASYGLLLELIAKEVNMVPDELIGNLGDTHLYLNHIEQAKEQIGRIFTISEREELAGEGYLDRIDLKAFYMEFYGDPEWYVSHARNGELGTSIAAKAKILDILGIPEKTRIPFELPELSITQDDGQSFSIYDLRPGNLDLANYQSHPAIKADLSN